MEVWLWNGDGEEAYEMRRGEVIATFIDIEAQTIAVKHVGIFAKHFERYVER